jgi:hypothetical protein
MPSPQQDQHPLPNENQDGVKKGIAQADEEARRKAGTWEPVRNTPPSGDWNDDTPGG